MLLHSALLLLAAAGGSLHCLGMCGGFVAGINALGSGASRLRGLAGHLVYHGGRLTGYMFLGAVAGACGHLLTAPAPFLHSAIDLVAGLFVLLTGLGLAGLLPTGNLVQLAGAESLARPLGALLRARRLSSALYLGLFNGFIPCPLIAAFLAQAAATGSPLPGAFTMALLVLGTAPGMILLGYVALRRETRGKAVQGAGVLLAVLGIMTTLHAVGLAPSPFGDH
ncbi:MAG: sulfite exporter TauE/SafE family protein [Candidatus Tectomicrobia bacterium]|nr:sulfite exporter TauE/SafE family protein [Candidatus Tectomicrobia bacterium]